MIGQGREGINAKSVDNTKKCDNDFNTKEASNRNIKSYLHSVEIKDRLLWNLLFGGLCIGLIENLGSEVAVKVGPNIPYNIQ